MGESRIKWAGPILRPKEYLSRSVQAAESPTSFLRESSRKPNLVVEWWWWWAEMPLCGDKSMVMPMGWFDKSSIQNSPCGPRYSRLQSPAGAGVSVGPAPDQCVERQSRPPPASSTWWEAATSLSLRCRRARGCERRNYRQLRPPGRPAIVSWHGIIVPGPYYSSRSLVIGQYS